MEDEAWVRRHRAWLKRLLSEVEEGSRCENCWAPLGALEERWCHGCQVAQGPLIN